MEKIKVDLGMLEDKNGIIHIILPADSDKIYPSHQSEIIDMDVSYDEKMCTITGMQTEFRVYENKTLEKWTPEQIEEAPFDKKEIIHGDKRKWFFFIKKIPYLNGFIRLKKKTPVTIITTNWTIIDRRSRPVKLKDKLVASESN